MSEYCTYTGDDVLLQGQSEPGGLAGILFLVTLPLLPLPKDDTKCKIQMQAV